jgi:predicted HicB family RNase H-like nuclease
MSIAIKEEGNNMGEIVQLSIRIDKDIRQKVKIMALKKDTTVNDLVTQYVIEGLNKEKE